MMIFAIQPVIAIHFCGGKLKSFDLFTVHTATDINSAGLINLGDNHSCCDFYNTHEADNQNHGRYIAGNSCCNTELLEFTTDDYQNKAEQQTSRPLSFSIENVGSVLTGIIQLPDPETDIRTPLTDFPPGGLFMKDVNLLTYICIYRI